MKRALITGITGQDGGYLAKLLLGKGYQVFGCYKRSSNLDLSRLRELEIDRKVELVLFELTEFSNILRVLEKVKPDEVFNLAAQSFVGASFDQPIYTSDSNALGVLRLLEAIRTVKPDTRFYQASTSEMFGKVAGKSTCNEESPMNPRSPYAVAKLFGHWITRNYRESYGMFACSGILFNHESPLRGHEFVTRKITQSVACIKHGLQERVALGNLDSMRDWGYAPEYVEAMWLMLQQPAPDDYVVATGTSHSVRQFVEAAFRVIDVEIAWEGQGVEEKGRDAKTGAIRVEINPEFYRPAEVDYLHGDFAKATARLGWKPRTTFDELVKVMVVEDLRRTGR
ncbi:MAG: GDP-mannose 4,6-dehydratase [Deltaproteobacteria bacterium]|nr:GDP-mannose 4,6-dehydratase [Deltaproteobacteria bacterium]